MHRTILLVCCALLGLAPACSVKRAEYAAEAPSPDYDGAAPAMAGGGDSGGEREVSASYSSKDIMPMEEATPEVASKATTPTTLPASPVSPPNGGVDGRISPTKTKPEATSGQNKEDDAGKEPQKQVARQIIYTAEMQISVFKFDEAMERAEALTLESGGYVQSMSQGYYVLRVPAAKLRGVMAELGKLGVVESRSLQAQDVTEEFVDLSTRIRVLKETQLQLLTLLKQARNVEEALSVRRSLDQITMQLEQAMGRLRMLESLIGFSTLTVRMSQRGPQNAIPSSNDPFPWVDALGVEATEWN